MTKGAKMLEKEPKPKPTGGLLTHNYYYIYCFLT